MTELAPYKASQIDIRLLGTDDIALFRDIRLEALRTEPSAYASTAADWQTMTDNEWRSRITNNSVFVGFADDRPIAMMGLMRQQASKMAHRATIIMVYVQKEFRGTGIASALLGSVKRYAIECGIRQLELAASAANPAAIRFYQREGFREVGRIPAGFIHDGREIDDVIMAARIVE